jgi:hypothetical protein
VTELTEVFVMSSNIKNISIPPRKSNLSQDDIIKSSTPSEQYVEQVGLEVIL